MTRMTTTAEQRREELENILTSLSVARVLLEKQAILRVSQAVDRDNSLCALLEPAVGYISKAADEMQRAGQYLGVVWRDGEKKGWK